MKTYSANPQDIDQKWYVVDLEGQTVGRAASRVAHILRGKHRPTFTPHVDMGDYVIALNADKVVFTGNKAAKKVYNRHTGYPGGIKEITAEKLLEKRPEDVFTYAVQGMLPKNSLGRQLIKKLKVYTGAEHPHEAQTPETLSL